MASLSVKHEENKNPFTVCIRPRTIFKAWAENNTEIFCQCLCATLITTEGIYQSFSERGGPENSDIDQVYPERGKLGGPLYRIRIWPAAFSSVVRDIETQQVFIRFTHPDGKVSLTLWKSGVCDLILDTNRRWPFELNKDERIDA